MSGQNRMQRHCFLEIDTEPLESKVNAAQIRLLKAVISSDIHVLRSLFPPIAYRPYLLRPRLHPFILPRKDDHFFIPRVYSLVNNTVKDDN